jgi:hypothetical protein
VPGRRTRQIASKQDDALDPPSYWSGRELVRRPRQLSNAATIAIADAGKREVRGERSILDGQPREPDAPAEHVIQATELGRSIVNADPEHARRPFRGKPSKSGRANDKGRLQSGGIERAAELLDRRPRRVREEMQGDVHGLGSTPAKRVGERTERAPGVRDDPFDCVPRKLVQFNGKKISAVQDCGLVRHNARRS